MNIKPCPACHRPTRPQGSSIEDAPGTTTRSGGGLCNMCYARRYQAGEIAQRRIAPKISLTCARCGYRRPSLGSNSSAICRDCRLVLSAEEKELWAA